VRVIGSITSHLVRLWLRTVNVNENYDNTFLSACTRPFGFATALHSRLDGVIGLKHLKITLLQFLDLRVKCDLKNILFQA
jgi:hypothetical protein